MLHTRRDTGVPVPLPTTDKRYEGNEDMLHTRRDTGVPVPLPTTDKR